MVRIARRLAVGLLLVLAVIVFFLARSSRQPVTSYIRQIPEMGVVYLGTAIQSVKSTVAGNAQTAALNRRQQDDLRKLREENLQLKIEVENLKSELERQKTSRDVAGEFPQLSGQITVTAPIILRSPSRWLRQAIIPLGSRQGVQTRSAVISPDGVVGLITEVDSTDSVLKFITDPQFVLGGKVERTGETMILQGTGAGGSIKFLPLRTDVHVGDVLLTSGQDGLFPEGLKVGTVTKTSENLGRATLDVEFAPGVAFDKLKWVVLLEPRRAPAIP